jgi:hypothetical protein
VTTQYQPQKIMAISKEVRAKIVEQASDYTYAELAEMHKCSKSSVQRIVSAANSSTAATGGGGSGSRCTRRLPAASTDPTPYPTS